MKDSETPKRICYFNGPGVKTMTLLSTEGEWKVGDVSITESLKAFHAEAIVAAEAEKEIDAAQFMSLNFIFLFEPTHCQEFYGLPSSVTKSVINSLDLPETIDVEDDLAIHCRQVVKKIEQAKKRQEKCEVEDEDEFDEVYSLLNGFENKAIKEKKKNEKKLIQLLRAMLLKCPSWQTSPATEDTMIIQSLVALFDVFLNCDRRYSHAWTHGFLDCSAVATQTASATTSASATTNINSNTKRSKALGSIKPDFVLRFAFNTRQFDVFVVEVKNKGAKSLQIVNDKAKLAYELKIIVNSLVDFGVVEPQACGLLVEGDLCQVYRLDLYKEAVYRFVCVGQFNLPRNYIDFCLFPSIMEQMLLVKSLIDKTANNIANRQPSVFFPSYYRRPSFTLPSRTNHEAK
ncbi:hypothetical protein EDC96DRAFT_203187 [Choanephora cucurbitarum]|nr:hypothetical protein EDC96DRAFT_203187 [Choanephora cucurbitarum]